MYPQIKQLVLLIRSLESQLESKRSRLQEIRQNCNHVWEKYDGKDEDGTILFDDEICKICGELKQD